MHDLKSITLARVDAWISLLHGPFRSQCEATDEQFEALLEIALTYRVFVTGHARLGREDFKVFAGRLVQAAVECHPLERTDDELKEVVGWLHVNLPDVRPANHDRTTPQDRADTA